MSVDRRTEVAQNHDRWKDWSEAFAQQWDSMSIIPKKPFLQWDGLMKSYYKKYDDKCHAADTQVDVSLDGHDEKYFATGSSYKGEVNAFGMNGYGEFTFPSGVKYRGDFRDGQFHGNGELVFNTGPEAGSIVRGEWVDGVLKKNKILFDGKLEYDTEDWMYCVLPDRRYTEEYATGLYPAGQSLITPKQPPRTIPPGCYDTGDGFYDPNTKVVFNYDNTLEVKRAPSRGERKWIIDNCRKDPEETLGPRPDLYETWVEPEVNPLPPPEPLVGFKYSSTSTQYQENEDKVHGPVFYDSSLIPTYKIDANSSILTFSAYKKHN